MSSDLSYAQNERLRAAMKAAIGEGKTLNGRPTENINQFARAIGRAQASVNVIINGRSGASYETVRRFAEALGKTVHEVIGDRDEEQQPQAKTTVVVPEMPENLRLALERVPATEPEIELLLSVRASNGLADTTVEGWAEMILWARRTLKHGLAMFEVVKDDPIEDLKRRKAEERAARLAKK